MNNKPHIDRINEMIGDMEEAITDHLTNSNIHKPGFRKEPNSKYISNCFLEIETLTVAKILMELHDKNFTKEE